VYVGALEEESKKSPPAVHQQEDSPRRRQDGGIFLWRKLGNRFGLCCGRKGGDESSCWARECMEIQIKNRNGEQHILEQPEDIVCLYVRSSRGCQPEDDTKACGKGSSNIVPGETRACEDDGAHEVSASTAT
jgi:hypothetical protein